MAKLSKAREGTLQFAPRVRAKKFLPRVNWSSVKFDAKTEGVLGFIAYKVGMGTAIVKDTTPASLTLNKKIALPVTILEAPEMKVFSVRFYLHGIPIKDIIVSNDKELKKLVRVPDKLPEFKAPEHFDNITVQVYSLVKKTNFKKTPDISEVAINAPNKLEYVKSIIGKELSIKDFAKHTLIDVRGLTAGKGFTGTVKRFGISFKQHKSEKGRRRPGSLGPWHPARVTFRTPMAGQGGMHTRVHYNQKVVFASTIAEKNINKKEGFMHFGNLGPTSSYILVQGSVQGPQKRQVLLTSALRPTKKTMKKKFEFQELVP